MHRIFLALALTAGLATLAQAQVPINSATTRIPRGSYTMKDNGGSTYRQGGTTITTDGQGNSRTTYGGWTYNSNGTSKYNGPTYGYPKK